MDLGTWDMARALTTPITDRPGTPCDDAPAAAPPRPGRGKAGRPLGAKDRGPRKRRYARRLADLSEALASDILNNPWGLHERPLQVLQLLVKGCKRPEIARRMGIRPKTVSQHLMTVRATMRVQTNTQAVLMWHRHYQPTMPPEYNKDALLIANLAKATAQLRAQKQNDQETT